MKFTEHPVTVEIINAKRATEYLAKNVCNPRPRNPKIVESWAREMIADRWYLSNDALIFDTDGNLGNGQHRMKALLEAALTKADIAIPFLVGRGYSKEEIEKMDRGVPRSLLRIVKTYCLDITGKDNSVYSSILCDAYTRNRLNADESIKMHNALGAILHSLNNTDTDFYSQAFIKKSALLAIIADKENADYTRKSYEMLVLNGNGALPASASPAVKSFVALGHVRTNKRTSRDEVAAQARYIFTYGNRNKNISSINIPDTVLSLQRESTALYNKVMGIQTPTLSQMIERIDNG